MHRFRKWLHLGWAWCLTRLWIWLPFLRPPRVRFLGRVRPGWRGVLVVDAASTLEFGDVSLGDSSVVLANSRLHLPGGQLTGFRLRLRDCQVDLGRETRMRSGTLDVQGARFSAGDHLFLDGLPTAGSRLPFLFQVHGGTVALGQNVRLEAAVSVLGGQLHIGSHVMINAGTEVRCEESVDIGDYVLVSYDCVVFDTNTHAVPTADRRLEIDRGFPNRTARRPEAPPATRPIVIGTDSWIGMRSILLKGSRLGREVIVGAGAVVGGPVPDRHRAVGNPAQVRPLPATPDPARSSPA